MPSKSVTMRFVAFIASALLLGCQGLMPQKPSPPSTSGLDGTCVSACELKKTQCEQRQVAREQTCRDYQMQFQTSGRSCVTRYGSHCVEPVECIGANVGICEAEMSECLLDCRSAAAQGPAAAEPPPDTASTRRFAEPTDR